MKNFKTQSELKSYLNSLNREKVKVGLVPTMGALHQGHLSLIEASQKNCDLTIASIFVNPTQFNNPDDLLKYPKPIEKDMEMLNEIGCDVLFHPDVDEMYQKNEGWNYQVGFLNTVLEGAFRPGHYEGVTQIVYKLFDLVKPDRAYFGQKDYQQFLVISQMNQDFKMGIELKACPIVRENDGLAMSSRNIHLNSQERKSALTLYQSLKFVRDNYQELSLSELLEKAQAFYQKDRLLNLEYFKICDVNTLEELNEKTATAIALVACTVGQTRLIDNVILP
ncbi:MAG: pantoate--beta-alanine ligase [Sphingobacteriales bacterium]|nr:pantoate--beta-alanine ligase [Sphingobacteriales bacterium]